MRVIPGISIMHNRISEIVQQPLLIALKYMKWGILGLTSLIF